jgi:hypothetical protein
MPVTPKRESTGTVAGNFNAPPPGGGLRGLKLLPCYYNTYLAHCIHIFTGRPVFCRIPGCFPCTGARNLLY